MYLDSCRVVRLVLLYFLEYLDLRHGSWSRVSSTRRVPRSPDLDSYPVCDGLGQHWTVGNHFHRQPEIYKKV